MITLEPELLANYVASGQARLVFWPVLNHGNPSLYSTITMECAGQQSAQLAWDMHAYLFDNQISLWRAERDFYVAASAELGLDQAAFEACYDGEEALQTVLNLDFIRRERGIVSQPFFDVGGVILGGTGQLVDTINRSLP